MKTLQEIRENPAVIVTGLTPEMLVGVVTLRRGGKPRNYTLIIGADEGGLEHASISCMDKSHIPSWEELCELKDIVWKDEEECYQVFPKKSQYVNIMENCMHIWRKK